MMSCRESNKRIKAWWHPSRQTLGFLKVVYLWRSLLCFALKRSFHNKIRFLGIGWTQYPRPSGKVDVKIANIFSNCFDKNLFWIFFIKVRFRTIIPGKNLTFFLYW